MLAPLIDEVARLRAEDMQLQACRDRQERIALRAAGEERRRFPLMRRKRDGGLGDAAC